MASLWSADRAGREIKQARRLYEAAIGRMRVTFPTRGSVTVANAAELTIECLRGMGWLAWQELDERSGYRDLEDWRFALVRQTRNSPLWGRPLLEAVNEPPRLTQAYVRDQLRPLGVSISKRQENEYHVRVIGSPAGEGYFTPDLRDALDTGRAMAAEKQRNTNLARLGGDQ